jgi:ankyrin repeat protein
MSLIEDKSSKSPLMMLPNELLCEVAPHLKSFKDLNSLVRTSHFFHGMFNTDLYRRAIDADDAVLDGIVGLVLSRYRLASLTLFLDNGLSANYTAHLYLTWWKGTMLYFLCTLIDEGRSVPLARLLIQRGADMKARDYPGSSRTALHMAAFCNKRKIAALLLGHHGGADVNAADGFGTTPLHCASRPEMVELLIAHGATVDARNRFGMSPLHHAVKWYHKNIITTLLAHGASANTTGESGRTPLHLALESRLDSRARLPLAKLLLEHGADVNAISNDGISPLQCAILRENRADEIEQLLEYGADVSVLDRAERQLLSRIVQRDF